MNFTHFNHFNSEGKAVMVDVGDKEITTRIAVAEGSIKVNSEVFYAIKNNTAKKGDVLAVARIAGIMAAKKDKRYHSAVSSALYHQSRR